MHSVHIRVERVVPPLVGLDGLVLEAELRRREVELLENLEEGLLFSLEEADHEFGVEVVARDGQHSFVQHFQGDVEEGRIEDDDPWAAFPADAALVKIIRRLKVEVAESWQITEALVDVQQQLHLFVVLVDGVRQGRCGEATYATIELSLRKQRLFQLPYRRFRPYVLLQIMALLKSIGKHELRLSIAAHPRHFAIDRGASKPHYILL